MAEYRMHSLWWLPGNYTEIGQEIDFLYYVIFWMVTAVFIVTEALLIVYIIKFRAKPGVRAKYSHGNNTYEIIWTTIPAIIFFALAFYSDNIWFKYMEGDNYVSHYRGQIKSIFMGPSAKEPLRNPIPADALHVEVLGEQFGWNIRYAGADGVLGRAFENKVSTENKLGLDPEDPAGKDDIILYNQMTIPVGRAVQIHLRSKDVIHAFYVPEFRLYQDAVPGRTISWLWFKTTGTGHFAIACSQLCGSGHYNMQSKLDVVAPEEFEKWMNAKIEAKKLAMQESAASELLARKN